MGKEYTISDTFTKDYSTMKNEVDYSEKFIKIKPNPLKKGGDDYIFKKRTSWFDDDRIYTPQSARDFHRTILEYIETQTPLAEEKKADAPATFDHPIIENGREYVACRIIDVICKVEYRNEDFLTENQIIAVEDKDERMMSINLADCSKISLLPNSEDELLDLCFVLEIEDGNIAIHKILGKAS